VSIIIFVSSEVAAIEYVVGRRFANVFATDMQPDSAAGLDYNIIMVECLSCLLFGGRRFCYFSSLSLLFEEVKF